MKTTMSRILIYVLVAISAASYGYSLLMALSDRYQESILVLGVAFIVLAQAVFVYRIYRYPDARKG
jgi:hypothetical protein